ncbi:MAG: response regulator transcription factor [Actinobacteria bacterium]|nr:response regulator transcription factor [Actinomycetota bacterium]
MIKVQILDDHPIVRKGLRQVLENEPGLKLIGEAADYGDLKKLLGKALPDVLVLDIELPDCDGLDVLKDVRSAYPQVRVLILSVHPEDQMGVRCLKNGAMGYLSKDRISGELVSAIRKVASGGRYITESVAERLAAQVDKTPVDMPHEMLSDRELQVIRMVAQGLEIKEIAEKLSISASTVRTYRERIINKMGMKNDSELTYYAVKNGLIE